MLYFDSIVERLADKIRETYRGLEAAGRRPCAVLLHEIELLLDYSVLTDIPQVADSVRRRAQLPDAQLLYETTWAITPIELVRLDLGVDGPGRELPLASTPAGPVDSIRVLATGVIGREYYLVPLTPGEPPQSRMNAEWT